MDSMSSNKQFSSAYDVLSYIFSHFGAERMRESRQLLGIFDDLAPKLVRERKQLSYLLQCNGHILLLDSIGKTKEQQDLTCKRIINIMTQDCMLDLGVCEEIVYTFLKAISNDNSASEQHANNTWEGNGNNVSTQPQKGTQESDNNSTVPNKESFFPCLLMLLVYIGFILLFAQLLGGMSPLLYIAIIAGILWSAYVWLIL